MPLSSSPPGTSIRRSVAFPQWKPTGWATSRATCRPCPERFNSRSSRKFAPTLRRWSEDEFPALARGNESERASAAFDELYLAYHSFEPKTQRESGIFGDGLDRLSEIREQRRLRLEKVSDGIPGVLWFALLAGAAVTIASTYFLGSKTVHSQMALTAMFAGIIALSLVVIFAFDLPFLGGDRLSSAPFQTQAQEATRFLLK
ncbi:MAG: DUF4239 domain-containing protein [Chloroflexi bacterium]|nr:DUF4239 domain-containing protein [Chloroflexota bacterium]